MLLNHTTAFSDIQAVALETAPCFRATLTAQTRLETEAGWVTVDTLQAGDAVATLDGGFATITGITRPRSAAPLVHIPGGTLHNCSDVAVPGDAYVGLRAPDRWIDTPIVSLPVQALSGWRGVRPTLFSGGDLAQLQFANEEMLFAQTGMLVHAGPADGDSFFPRLGYGDARAVLSLSANKIGQPDTVAA